MQTDTPRASRRTVDRSSPSPAASQQLGTGAVPLNMSKTAPPLPGEGKLRTEGWLLAQPPSHYTLQLTASHDREAALGYVETHDLRDTAAWFRTLHEDKAWYVVVSGSYPTRDAALQAMRQLSTPLRRQGPWTRSFASIQASIAQSRSTR